MSADPAIDGIELRNAFGQFTTGVTLVTASPANMKPFGMTVNSFSSLSLDPPLLLWSLQKNSDTWDAWEASQHFAVNILAADQQEISDRYAKKGEHDLDDAHYRMADSGMPVLNHCVASFECEIAERYEGGDHIILVGRVVVLNSNPDVSPLVFQAGKYRTLA